MNPTDEFWERIAESKTYRTMDYFRMGENYLATRNIDYQKNILASEGQIGDENRNEWLSTGMASSIVGAIVSQAEESITEYRIKVKKPLLTDGDVVEYLLRDVCTGYDFGDSMYDLLVYGNTFSRFRYSVYDKEMMVLEGFEDDGTPRFIKKKDLVREVSSYRISPFNVDWSPIAKEFMASPWYAERSVVSRDWAEQEFSFIPGIKDKIDIFYKSGSRHYDPDYWANVADWFLYAKGYSASGMGNLYTQRPGPVLGASFAEHLVEMYEYFDDVNYAVYIGDTQVYKGANYFGRSIIGTRFIRNQERSTGISILDATRPDRKVLDLFRNIRIDNAVETTQGGYLFRERNLLDPAGFSLDAGSLNRVRNNAVPFGDIIAPIPKADSSNIEEIEESTIKQDVAEKTGVGSLVLGGNKGQFRTGTEASDAFQVLSQRMDTHIDRILEHEKLYAKHFLLFKCKFTNETHEMYVEISKVKKGYIKYMGGVVNDSTLFLDIDTKRELSFDMTKDFDSYVAWKEGVKRAGNYLAVLTNWDLLVLQDSMDLEVEPASKEMAEKQAYIQYVNTLSAMDPQGQIVNKRALISKVVEMQGDDPSEILLPDPADTDSDNTDGIDMNNIIDGQLQIPSPPAASPQDMANQAPQTPQSAAGAPSGVNAAMIHNLQVQTGSQLAKTPSQIQNANEQLPPG